MKALNGFIRQRIDTSARLLEARKITFGYPKNCQNYWHAEKLVHSAERILTSSGTYWHTDLFIIKDILDHSVTVHFIIYWVTFANLFNSLFYYMIIYYFVINFYLILYMSVCFRTPKMERIEMNNSLIIACLQDQEWAPSKCQPINVSIATTPAIFANTH